VHFLAVMTEEKEPGRSAAADDGKEPDRGDDQLELAFRRGGWRFRAALRLFIVCHRQPARFSENERDAARQA
jgi:hypothetical protein